ncbi:MAG: hypothetical protein ACC655_11615 [Rhodothermia bacterium]
MSIEFAPGVPDKIREQIAKWGMPRVRLAEEIFDRIEALDDNPGLGEPDESGLFSNAFVYQFRIEMLPVVLIVPAR